MKCVICGIETDGIKEAIDRAWTPYFYEAKIERGSSVDLPVLNVRKSFFT